MSEKNTAENSVQRSNLLKLCWAKGMSIQQIMKIVEPMKELSIPEKEKMAERLIIEVEKM